MPDDASAAVFDPEDHVRETRTFLEHLEIEQSRLVQRLNRSKKCLDDSVAALAVADRLLDSATATFSAVPHDRTPSKPQAAE